MTPRIIAGRAGIRVRRDLTPKKKVLYSEMKTMYRKLKRVTHSKQNFKKRLFAADKFTKEHGLEENLGKLNSFAAQFIRCQVREAGNSKKQHRFTSDEKMLALMLYNHSPRAYRFLARVFILPARSTLTKFLDMIHFKPGVNIEIFEALKRCTENLSESDKYVSVIFDEMAIMPALNFNEREGCIHGFEDLGSGARSQQISTHSLVFMVRGLKKRFKQPLCYVFSSKGGAKAAQIQKILKQILELLLDVGLKPITIICDQAQVNMAVIKALLQDTRAEYLRKGDSVYLEGSFELKGFRIFPIFDPPHMLKGIRNNFSTKCIEYFKDGEKRIADWKNIIALYEIDNGPNMVDGLRTLPHLTDEHVYLHKIKKMKVKNAAQVLSQRVAATMLFVSNLGKFLFF